MTCAQCRGADMLFDAKVARRDLKRLRRRGPDKTTRWLLDALTEGGARDMTFLDVGGGVGAVLLDLMARGAAGGTHADASSAYLASARAEAEARGFADRVRFLEGDFVELAPQIDVADLVTLDRVVCCYPDMPALVDAASTRARRALGLVFPRDTWLMRVGATVLNLMQRLRRHPFRMFLHAPDEVVARVESHGLSSRLHRHSLLWNVFVFTRRDATPSA